MSRYSDEQVIAAIDAAPPLVREVLRDMKTSQIIGSIGTSYHLHIDLIGKLSALNRDLLIGLTSPAEVLGELIMAGVDTETAKNILKELNEKIFMPVQAAMKAGSEKETSSQGTPAPMRIEADIPPPTPPTTTPTDARPVAETPSVPAAVSTPQQTPEPPMPTQHTAYAAQGTPQQGAAWHPAASVHVFVPSHPSPHANVPPNLPGQEAPVPVQTTQPIAAPVPKETQTPLIQAASQTQDAPLTKQYSIDPYREPI